MSRTLWCAGCLLAALSILLCGWLMPAHLRAVDNHVLLQAGLGTPSLIEKGSAFVARKNLGAARLLANAAEREKLAGRDNLLAEVRKLQATPVPWSQLGCADATLQHLISADPAPPGSNSPPFTEVVIRQTARTRALEFLQSSRQVDVQSLLQCRALTNTVLIPPSSSSSGQAFDAGVIICGLLLQDHRLTPELSRQIFNLASDANREGKTEGIEQVLLDLLSLGQRLDWGQLSALLGPMRDAQTLRQMTGIIRSGADLPVIFSAVEMSGRPAAVAQYCLTWNQTGISDLGTGLRYNSGAVAELVRRNVRVESSPWRERAAKFEPFASIVDSTAALAWLRPGVALGIKWFLYFAGGFLLALGARQLRGPVPVLELPLQVRGFHLARETLFGLGLLVVVLLVSEPFLAQESQKVELPFRLRLPTVGSVAPAGNAGNRSVFMNQLSLLTLLLFFVLQGLLYIACLVKLAEIRRQRVNARIKLRLLDNEEHLFDAGLYLGFCGTIVSLILVSLGVVKPSLMAAYSSTSFGIIFVSIFKIFNLRPAKRRLLLESEADAGSPVSAPGRVLAPTP